jgi:hypothetical protein
MRRQSCRALSALAGVATLLLVTACGKGEPPTAPAIPFAPREDAALKDPDNPIKVFRVDLAKVEQDFPLSRSDLTKITPENLKALSQEEVDQIYGRLTAGPIPDGPHQGDLFFAQGESLQKRVGEIIGGIEGRIADDKIKILERLGASLWKGKMFYRDERELRNLIEDRKVLEPYVGDQSTIMTAEIPRRDLLRFIFPTDKVWLLFPAKVYCGQSLVDSRRESIIVDYNYTDEVPGYRPSPDSLAGRGGLRIRDELRMVRPGFYLGRAYANRVFLLNFTVYKPDVADRTAASFAAGEAIAEECWPGEQARRAAAR